MNREIKRYSYCFSESFRNKRFKHLHDAYEGPMTEVVFLFYQSSLSAFINF